MSQHATVLEDMQADRAGPGHNNPPPDVELLSEKLVTSHKDLLARRQALLEAVQRIPVECVHDQQAQDLTSFANQLQACAKSLEGERQKEKKYYDDMASVVHGFFRTRIEPLENAVSKVKRLLLDYKIKLDTIATKAREDQRKKDEAAALATKQEADRLAAQAATLEQAGMKDAAEKAFAQAEEVEKQAIQQQAAATVPLAPAKTVLRGSVGGSASSAGSWKVRITDIEKLDILALAPFIDREALEKAARAWMKLKTKPLKADDKAPELRGLEVYRDTSISLRG